MNNLQTEETFEETILKRYLRFKNKCGNQGMTNIKEILGLFELKERLKND